MAPKLTYRIRVPVRTTRLTTIRKGRRKPIVGGRMRRQKRLRGGFLPALIPILAAAIGAVPGIASVALQASQR